MSDIESLILYIAVYTTSTLLFILGVNKKSKTIKFLSMAVLILISSYRLYVGTDYITYTNMVRRFSMQSWSSIFSFENLLDEIGFRVLAKITFEIGGMKFFFAATTALTLVPIYIAIEKFANKKYLGLSLLFYLFVFYPSSYNIIRQFISISLLLYGFTYIFEKRFANYVLICLVAFMFHKTSLVALPLYLIWENENIINTYKRLFVIVSVLLSVIYYQTIINFFTSIKLFGEYSVYAEVQDRGNNRDFFFFLFIAIAFSLFYKNLTKMNKRNSFFILIFILGAVIGLTGYSHPQIKRIGLFLQVPAIILISYLPAMFDQKSRQIVNTLIVTLSIIYFLIVYFFLRNGHIIPYNF